MTDTDNSKARTLLNAVERMLDTPDEIAGVVERMRREGGGDLGTTATRIVSHYSNRCALMGGIAGMPGLFPGLGPVIAIAGTALAEMVALLKLEVEMCLALAHAYGYDIRETRERQLAFLLAAVRTREVSTGRNVLLDIGAVSLTAATNYTPRQLEKLLLKVLGITGLIVGFRNLPRLAAHALPLVGVGIGAGLNKVLTARVGKRAIAWYSGRQR